MSVYLTAHLRWLANLFAVSAIVFCASLKSVAADSEDLKTRIGTGNPQLGKVKADDGRCLECHGEDGNSSDLRIPKHAGQQAAYLIKQLSNFKSRERRHDTMNVMAEDLSESDMADIAAYFASQKIMQGDGGKVNPIASELFLNGDKSRAIPACTSCHGDKAKGRFAEQIAYPSLGGQQRVYLRTQLVNWKLADRVNSPGGVMNKIAKALSDDEIDALANFLSGL